MDNTPRILIVEDETLLALALRMDLQHLDYTVCGMVLSGEEAISAIEREHPNLILMDINLAGELDGIEAAKEIRRRFDIPILYMSGYSDPTIRERAEATAPIGYLLKPIARWQLQEKLAVCFSHSP